MNAEIVREGINETQMTLLLLGSAVACLLSPLQRTQSYKPLMFGQPHGNSEGPLHTRRL